MRRCRWFAVNCCSYHFLLLSLVSWIPSLFLRSLARDWTPSTTCLSYRVNWEFSLWFRLVTDIDFSGDCWQKIRTAWSGLRSLRSPFQFLTAWKSDCRSLCEFARSFASKKRCPSHLYPLWRFHRASHSAHSFLSFSFKMKSFLSCPSWWSKAFSRYFLRNWKRLACGVLA